MTQAQKILVVDDDPGTLKLVSIVLQREGLEPVMCTEPREIVELLVSSDARMLILDLLMPGFDGIEILRSIRAHPATRALPVLILSGKVGGPDRVRGLRAGADDYLPKPFEPEELVIRVRRLLAGGREDAGVLLTGTMGRFSAGDILQQVLLSGQEGVLEVEGPPTGRITVRNGAITAARCGVLEGEAALIVLLDRREGRFRLLEIQEGDPVGERHISLEGALMKLAWLEDETERRRQHLPEEDLPLAAAPEGAVPESECSHLEETLLWFRDHPGATLGNVVSAGLMAPQEARLAVALLVEEGLLHPREAPPGPGNGPDVPTRLSPSLESICANLAMTTARGGEPPRVLHVLVAVSPGRWDTFLSELISRIPEEVLDRPQDVIARELEEHASITLRIPSAVTTLLVHVHRLTGLPALRARAFLPLSTGILLVLSESPTREETELVLAVDRLDRPPVLVAIPPEDGVPLQLPEPWRIAATIPSDFEELLELLLD